MSDLADALDTLADAHNLTEAALFLKDLTGQSRDIIAAAIEKA